MAAVAPAHWGPKTHDATAGQTVGPFFAYGTEFERMNEIAFPHSPGAIVLGGTVFQGDGAPIPDAIIEVWGADVDGSIPRARGSRKRDGHTFTGYGRTFTDDEGHWEFWTRAPGATEPGRPAFFAVIVYARGLPSKLHTRIYLPDDEAALAADPFLASLDDDERASLIATRTPEGLRHDFRLQGEHETVFLAF
ncbi:protocatechuate 3,4-dioxygenase subunit alpha [Agromyces seonyuensis]|uniref:Protocatechuate 3,4-dioxygenase subunit alpha n=1 Tax=Agromyces seonyuensis TaxID=2662446 RepID=A0A6I4NSW3_9MICO|nr:protocatechuate 3,4-dioxygenase subunit alpha [Agromyces seonyuensis]MWB97221.1 protocatechuate 3,4-dioxygenase subunit alpha [Agromyces seonyuensis]